MFVEKQVRIPAATPDEAELSAMVSVPTAPADAGTPTAPAEAAAKKRAVVLVHGMFGSGTAKGVIPALAEALRERFVVCRIDLTGNGASGGEWRYAAYDREVADVERAVRFLRDTEGAETCAVAGHSKGGAVVLLYAASAARSTRPGCVFVTLGAKTVYDQGESKFSAEELARARQEGAFEWHKFGRVWRVTQADLDERVLLHDRMARALDRIAPARVLVVHGTEDAFVPLADADRIAEHCATAEKALIAGCGHYFRGFEAQMCATVATWVERNAP